jgi:Flp pilus assembly protein TadD
VLALRPHRLEALVKLGVLHARAGELDQARAPFEEAAALDPGHPNVLRNRVRLELESGELERGLTLLDELQQRGGAPPLWLRDLAAELLCRGLEREAQPVLALADERFADLTAEEAYELSNHYRANGAPLPGDGFRALADLLWARGHAAAGRFGDARRLYRQCLRTTLGYVVGGAPRVRMELAASMVRTDRVHEAEDELLGLEPRASDWAAIPEWARAALGELGQGPDAAASGQ